MHLLAVRAVEEQTPPRAMPYKVDAEYGDRRERAEELTSTKERRREQWLDTACNPVRKL